MDFEIFWDLFSPDVTFANRYNAARSEWEKCPPQKQQAMLEWLRQHGPYRGRNPYFFILDFRENRTLQMSFDDYYKKYGTTADTDGWTKHFLPDEHRTIYVKTTLPSRDHLPITIQPK